jgi:LytS/YehU family sensor histidine kinase
MRIGVGVILFFVMFCILGTMAGIWINDRYYALERDRERPSDTSPKHRY